LEENYLIELHNEGDLQRKMLWNVFGMSPYPGMILLGIDIPPGGREIEKCVRGESMWIQLIE